MREELEKLRRQALVELDQAARSEELLASGRDTWEEKGC